MPHFEIHVADSKAARSFYAGLFGWTFSPMAGAEDAEYHLIAGDKLGSDTNLTVGMMKRMGPAPASGSPVRGGTMTFEVADCDKSYDWALKHGGSEALPPMDYPNIGRVAYVEDGQGNIVGMNTPGGDE